MRTKEERDAAMANAGDAKAILSNDPTEIIVEGPDGALITWENRRGFGAQAQKLAYPERAGFHRHWFNDEPERVATARNAGYTPVVGDDGVPVARVVDKTTGMKAYLHEIPEAWYKADLAASQKRADDIDASIRKGNAPGPGGEVAGVDGQKFYGGIKIGRKATG